MIAISADHVTCFFVTIFYKAPTKVLLGSTHEWKSHKGTQKLEEVNHHGYIYNRLFWKYQGEQ